MSSNKAVKEELIRRYGKQCFIERLKLRDTSKLKYSGKGQYKKMKMLTYHHIKMKSQGGKATVDNGALLSTENHQWFHQQPKAEQEKMNNQFQELKKKIDNYEMCKVELAPEEEIEQPFEFDVLTAEIDLNNGKIKVQKKAKKKYNRAKQKKKNRKVIKRDYRSER